MKEEDDKKDISHLPSALFLPVNLTVVIYVLSKYQNYINKHIIYAYVLHRIIKYEKSRLNFFNYFGP